MKKLILALAFIALTAVLLSSCGGTIVVVMPNGEQTTGWTDLVGIPSGGDDLTISVDDPLSPSMDTKPRPTPAPVGPNAAPTPTPRPSEKEKGRAGLHEMIREAEEQGGRRGRNDN